MADVNNIKELKPIQKHIFFINTLAGSFFAATVYSLQGPFFPSEADKKGVSPSEYGFVFAVFSFMYIVVAAVIGPVLLTLGIKNTLCYSLMLQSFSTILFGFLTYITSGPLFLGCSIFLRIIEAIGWQGFNISSIVAISVILSVDKSFKLAIFESSFGIGTMVGPIVGSFLYALGGFVLPFATVGSMLLLCSIVSMLTIPKLPETDKKQTSLMGTLKMSMIPGARVNLYGSLVAGLTDSFLVAMLEPHIRQFNLPVERVGAMFMITPLAYTLFSPLWGWLVTSIMTPELVFAFGAVTKIIGLSVIGPLPFLGVQPSVILVGIGLFILGVSSGMSFIGSMLVLLNIGKNESSYSEDVATALMTSLWQMFLNVGKFVGPFLGGILFDVIGFPWVTFIFALLNALFLIILGIQNRFSRTNREETQPILKQ